jgi:ribosomal protein S18 acetylase RimI-like enzyme
MIPIDIRPPQTPDELSAGAQMMSSSEPWITLQRDYAQAYQSLMHPDKEVLIATHVGEPIGLIVINMHGVMIGYIQSVLVASAWRGRGVGTALLAHAEQRILRDSPNVFLLVSSFNHAAYRLYKRRGYQRIGEIPDFIVRGYSEIIMRKTIAPLAEYTQP